MENEVKSILNEVELPKNVLLLLELYGLRTVKDLSKLNDDILKEVEANVRDGSFHADQLSFLDSTNLEKFHIKPFDLRKLQKAIEIAGRNANPTTSRPAVNIGKLETLEEEHLMPTEKPVFSPLCYICREFMGAFRNELSFVTTYTEKPLFQVFEKIIELKMPTDDILSSAICQNCFIKINEYDEHLSLARRIQDDLLNLYKADSEPADIKPNVKHENDETYEIMQQNDELGDGFDIFSNLSSHSPSKRKQERRSYKRKKNLDEGLTVVEVDGQKIYQCDICKKLCKDRYKLKTHREIHTTAREICCNECGAMFKTMTCLYSHKKIHRERIYHECDLCDMKYIQKTQLRKHMDAIHLKKKDHICSICGKCYSRDTTLSKHMFVHKEEKDVVCTVCGFRTHTKPKMERHMKSHTGERNYSCTICGKRFLYSYNVTAHIKHVHNREKRKIDEEKLTCKFCGKRFQKIWKVKEHMAEVHQLVEGADMGEVDRKFHRANEHHEILYF